MKLSELALLLFRETMTDIIVVVNGLHSPCQMIIIKTVVQILKPLCVCLLHMPKFLSTKIKILT